MSKELQRRIRADDWLNEVRAEEFFRTVGAKYQPTSEAVCGPFKAVGGMALFYDIAGNLVGKEM